MTCNVTRRRRSTVGRSLAIGLAALCMGASAPTWPAGKDEHEVPKATMQLEARMFWYYQFMEKIESRQFEKGKVKGTFFDHQSIPFELPVSALNNPAARVAGYRLAIEQVIAFLEPGTLIDNAANRAYLERLERRLQTMTGLKLRGHDAWKSWYALNGDRLMWSARKGRLLVR